MRLFDAHTQGNLAVVGFMMMEPERASNAKSADSTKVDDESSEEKVVSYEVSAFAVGRQSLLRFLMIHSFIAIGLALRVLLITNVGESAILFFVCATA